MRMNGSYATLPAVIAVAPSMMMFLCLVTPHTRLGMQVLFYGTLWVLFWGTIALVGRYFDYRNQVAVETKPHSGNRKITRPWLPRHQ